MIAPRMVSVAGYTRADGTEVSGYTRRGTGPRGGSGGDGGAPPSSPGYGSGGRSGGDTPRRTFHVSGYARKDGTPVAPHVRTVPAAAAAGAAAERRARETKPAPPPPTPKKEFTVKDLGPRTGNTVDYVKRHPGRYEYKKTEGGYFYCREKEDDGTWGPYTRISERDYLEERPNGAHLVNRGMAAYIVSKLRGPRPGKEYLKDLNEALDADANLRRKTAGGNAVWGKESDAGAERDFLNYLKTGRGFKWTQTHDAKLAQYQNARARGIGDARLHPEVSDGFVAGLDSVIRDLSRLKQGPPQAPGAAAELDPFFGGGESSPPVRWRRGYTPSHERQAPIDAPQAATSDALTEADFARYVRNGTPFDWTRAHDAKLAQYTSQMGQDTTTPEIAAIELNTGRGIERVVRELRGLQRGPGAAAGHRAQPTEDDLLRAAIQQSLRAERAPPPPPASDHMIDDLIASGLTVQDLGAYSEDIRLRFRRRQRELGGV